MHISNQLILEALNEYVWGHLQAKKALITMLARSRLRYHQKFEKIMDDDCLIHPMKVLLIGQSGTGKTHLIESLRKVVHFPLVRIDATQLIPSGSQGGVNQKDLQKMIVTEATRVCQDYPHLYPGIQGAVDRTVIFVDEFDKLGHSFESSGKWNRHVQSNFLTMFDNKTDWSGISYVFAGAFNDITSPEVKSTSAPIGFNNAKGVDKKDLIDERVLKSGLIPEIVGRINAICELDVFTEDEIYSIVIERLLPRKQMDMAAFGLFGLEVSSEELRKISKQALESGQGVRYAQRALDKQFLDLEFDADVDEIIRERY